MRTQPASPRHQAGLTLIELSIALVVAMGVIGIGLGVYSAVRATSRSLSANGGLLEITAAVRATYPRSQFTGINAGTLINAGNIPETLLNSAHTGLVAPWGGDYTIAAQNYGSGVQNAFRITVDKVPKDVCVRLVGATQGQFAVVRMGSAASPGATIKDDAASPKVRYSETNAVAACATTNQITFIGL